MTIPDVELMLFADGELEPARTTAAFELGLGASGAAAPHAAVAIEAVDFGAGAGAVFLLETAASVTPVVWLDDDASVGG